MKNFTGISLLAYFSGIVVTTLVGTAFDATNHIFFTMPQPDFWSRFMFCAPGDLEGLGFILLVTLPVYGLLFRFLSGNTFHSHLAATLAGLGNSLIGCSFSVYALLDASSAVLGPRYFWVHLMNMPWGFIWLPIGVTTITFFLVLLIGKRFIPRTIT
jgi:hypothetical protein